MRTWKNGLVRSRLFSYLPLVLGILCGSTNGGEQHANAGDMRWVAVKGTFDSGGATVYGSLGAANSANTPGTLAGAVTWTDGSGNLWLFGGYGYDAAGRIGYLNNLWKYNPTNGQWTWVKGPGVADQAGSYGTQGAPANANIPGTRGGAVAWTDSAGIFWLFGGFGYDSSGNLGNLNDLWKYDRTTNQWTWVKGAKIIDSLGAYGTQGVPAAANNPSARYYAVSWRDPSGNLWLLGGIGYIGGTEVLLNDLWKYDRSSNQWTWFKGAQTGNQLGKYGTQGVAAAANTPGARDKAVTWTDSTGNLWLFGGYGYDSAGDKDHLNDLWKYNRSTNQWMWVNGSKTGDQHGIYGTQGVSAAANTPGARDGAVSWTDINGNFWLFGGDDHGSLNDLWKYNQASNQWTWGKGAKDFNQAGNYGTQGVAAASNNPGARYGSFCWIDGASNLWLFGGYGFDGAANVESLNDLWMYNRSSNQWTWVKGARTLQEPPVYGTQGVATSSNTPGARNSSASWTDTIGNLWLFGGLGGDGADNNDLWKYSQSISQWTWVKGNNGNNQPGIYGAQGVAAIANSPGARDSATSWSDNAGNLWLFGGYGRDSAGDVGWLNDLWKYASASNQWTWVKGTKTVNSSATYGTQGVFATTNTPGARDSAVSWTDSAGNLWLFGGVTFASGEFHSFSDLWKYDRAKNQWAWIKGPNSYDQSGTYGTRGVSATANAPGARNNAMAWTDKSGNLWLFGGYGKDSAGNWGSLNDVWKYDQASNRWTWVKGASTTGEEGIYGTQGTAADANTPGARYSSATWIDTAGNLWLFGGYYKDPTTSNRGWLNDFWKFSPASSQWTWINGSTISNQRGSHVTQGIPYSANSPGARADAVSWSDEAGNLWLFGGYGYDCTGFQTNLADLWLATTQTGASEWLDYE